VNQGAAARARLQELMARLPGVVVEDANGHSGFTVRGRRFAWLLVDHHGDGRVALSLKAPPGGQQALVTADPQRYAVPSYLGARGWVSVLLDGSVEADWDEVETLVEQAWRLSATKRAVSVYDAQR